MKEPKRLLSEGATDFERRLLGAVMNERPSAAMRSRMQKGLGLTGPLLWVSNVKALVADIAQRSTTGKAVLAVAAGGMVAAAGIAVAVSVGTASDADLPDASPARVEAPVEGRRAPPEPVTPVERRTLEAAPLEAAPAAPAALDTDGTASQLREEIALLDEARNALQRGARARAEAVLDDYRERFPRGLLGREAALLRRQTASKRELRPSAAPSDPGASEAKQ